MSATVRSAVTRHTTTILDSQIMCTLKRSGFPCPGCLQLLGDDLYTLASNQLRVLVQSVQHAESSAW